MADETEEVASSELLISSFPTDMEWTTWAAARDNDVACAALTSSTASSIGLPASSNIFETEDALPVDSSWNAARNSPTWMKADCGELNTDSLGIAMARRIVRALGQDDKATLRTHSEIHGPVIGRADAEIIPREP